MNGRDPRVARAAEAIAEALVTLRDLFAPADPKNGTTAHYTSNKSGPRPPGKGARWCRDHFPQMPGARKEGRDWVIAVVAFERWAEGATPRTGRPAKVIRGPWSPEAALEAASVRRPRGAS